MSPVILHDSSRSGALTWAEGLIDEGTVSGMILNPFATPRQAIPRVGRSPGVEGAPGARARIVGAGGDAYFDPTTHGVLAAGADLFDLYDSWGLWPGVRRGNATAGALEAHLDRVLECCDQLGLRPIAPTLPLASPTGPTADRAFELAERAVNAGVDAFVAIVGSSDFWTGGSALDAFIGQLVQLRPAGWSITVTRGALRYPWPGVDPSEVQGVCRTVHSLSLRDAPVIVSHGDLAGLPAIAAGASHVGSGWDLRHRVCADDLFRKASGIRRASQRVTHRRLLASLKRDESEGLLATDPALSERLVPGPLPPDYNAHWRHHLRALANRVNNLVAAGAREARVRRLHNQYARAAQDFDSVTQLIGRLEAGRSQWIDPFASGLDLYAQGEGW